MLGLNARQILVAAALAVPSIAQAATITVTGNVVAGFNQLRDTSIVANSGYVVSTNALVTNGGFSTTGGTVVNAVNSLYSAINGWGAGSGSPTPTPLTFNNFQVFTNQPLKNGTGNYLDLDVPRANGDCTGNGANSCLYSYAQTTVTGLAPNSNYGLSFDYAPGQTTTAATTQIEVYWGSLLLGSVSGTDNDGLSSSDWLTVSAWNLRITSGNSQTLTFVGVGADNQRNNISGLISNVRMAPVPLPPIVWMLGASMIGWLGFSSRKRLGS